MRGLAGTLGVEAMSLYAGLQISIDDLEAQRGQCQ
jgi:hypothetical protein